MFSLEKKKFRLVVDGIRAQDGQLSPTDVASMKHFMSPVFLGSAPDYLHKELKVQNHIKITHFESNTLFLVLHFLLLVVQEPPKAKRVRLRAPV